MIKFDSSLEIGVKPIDDQHRELIRIVNSYVQSGVESYTDTETEKMIDAICSYIKKHFSDEERLHANAGYPDAQAHKELHARYIKDFDAIASEYSAQGCSAKFTLKLTGSVIEWIVKHIKSADTKFAKFYKEKK